MRKLFGWALFFSLSGGAAQAAVARHYVYLFGYDDGQQSPEFTHTWATFVAVTGGKVEQQTISWLPRSGTITVLSLGPERGRNYTLAETFALARKQETQVGQWGPYETTPELYELATKQKKQLESGEIWYRILDTPNRIFKALDPKSEAGPRAFMCSHAIADVVLPVDPKGFLLTGTTAGFTATAKVAWHLTDWYKRSNDDPNYLSAISAADKAVMDEALGLAKFGPIKQFALAAQNNNYCAGLEECRRVAGALTFEK